MVPILSFIGWHNSGKTTLASRVVAHLVQRGYRIAVIKSTKETGIRADQPGTDTAVYRSAGSQAVCLVAPDQMVLQCDNPGVRLNALVHRYFSDMDMVVAEGFKHERQIPKIEVTRGDSPLLRDEVTGVIAMASDRMLSGDYVFRLDESAEIADFIEKRFLRDARKPPDRLTLLLNGRKMALKPWVQEALTGAVTGFIGTLKHSGSLEEIELRIRLDEDLSRH